MQLVLPALACLASLGTAAANARCPLLNNDGIAPIIPRDVPATDSSLQKRDYQDVLARMAIVATNLMSTTKAINALQPNAPDTAIKAGNVAEQALVLSQHVRDVIATANASAPYGDHGSMCQERANSYHYKLIKEMTNAIVAKKSSWATAIALKGDVSKTIHNAIITEKNLVMGPGGFAEAVRRKTKPQYSVIEETMGPFFDHAIAQFARCTGQICLPAFIPPLEAYQGPP